MPITTGWGISNCSVFTYNRATDYPTGSELGHCWTTMSLHVEHHGGRSKHVTMENDGFTGCSSVIYVKAMAIISDYLQLHYNTH